MTFKKLFTILGLGASFVALAYPDAPTNHAAIPNQPVSPKSVTLVTETAAPPAATIGSGDLSHVELAPVQAQPDGAAALPPDAVALFTQPPPAETPGPPPLTEDEFADLQKWLRAGKPLQEWIDKNSAAFNCPTCKGAGIFHGAMCPTCDGAANAAKPKNWEQTPAVCATCAPSRSAARTYQQARPPAKVLSAPVRAAKWVNQRRPRLLPRNRR